MTKKLYYEDGYMTEFTGKVISCEEGKKGLEVVLDQTAFYPEGGGQPADTGSLEGSKVSYVFVKEGIIYHVVDKPLKVGCEVKGSIDFERRFDLMQQHSGEHIISGLVNSRFGYNNVGFHMSDSYTTCDFDGEITKEQMEEIETKANEAVYQNLTIDSTVYNDQEIKEIPYRSKLELVGDVRLVTVPGYDTCACCGVHVKTTGEIGLIKCTNIERHRGGVRVTMVCGKRALKEVQQKQNVIAEVSKMLSAKTETVVPNLSKVQEELNQMKQKAAALSNELFAYKAEEYVKTEEPALYVYEPELGGDMLRRLALMLIEKTDKKVLVVTGAGENLKYALAAKSEDVRPLNKLLTGQFSGKGGGKNELCQGNLTGNEGEIYEFFKCHYDAQ